jgi:signal transduction histidine kinase
MTGILLLDWAAMAASLFNTVLLLWLGLTVLLNAQRRTWGVWLAGGGMLMGGAFFVSHSAILGHGLSPLGPGLDFWWRAGWVPVVVSPLAWYVVMLWYAGFWEDRDAPLHRRQRPGLLLTLALAGGLALLLALANPLPSFSQVAQLDLSATPTLGGVPVLLLIYPAYIVLSIGLSLDALRRPGPSDRVMGELARHRARPWLVGASLALLAVSLLVAGVMTWVTLNARRASLAAVTPAMALTVAGFDLLIAALIGLSVILLGRAIVSYEVFTGKALPRRGFFRHWRSAVILAAGYGVVVGGALTAHLRAIYVLLLTTVLMVTFYALFSWRSFAERERTMARLRPFVTGQRLYDRLLTPTAPPAVDVELPFRALCADILDARRAYLMALGPLASLVGPPLRYGGGDAPPAPPPSDAPGAMCVPVDPATYAGATWAVPLWSERGPIGVLLLGEKRDGGLYTQEEMEIARAVGERLIDTQASAQLARRLMALQRQRLAQEQVIDQRTRRTLHDEVLPRLHAALLTLNGGAPGEALPALVGVHQRISDLLRQMPAAVAPEVARRGLVGALRRAVDGEFGAAFDGVTWQVAPQAEGRARAIPPLTAEVVFYAAREAVRNAARHGRVPGRPLHLRVAVAWEGGLRVVVEDDGAGWGGEGHDGQGLRLHTTMMAVVGGTLAVEGAPGAYTRVTLQLPQGEEA